MVTVTLRTVLVVDEAPPVRRKLLEILRRAGVPTTDIVMAESRGEALEAFVRRHPALVFCELVGASPSEGLEMVLEFLRVDPQAKVVLVTAEDPSSAHVRAAVRAGAFGVVRKPLRHDAIRQVLADIDAEDAGIERLR